MITPVTLVLSFLAAGSVVMGITPLVVRLARRLRFFDFPDARKVHQKPVPLLGGLAIVGGTIGVLVGVSLRAGLGLDAPRIGFLAGALIIFLVGIADDRYGLSVLAKLAGQCVAAACLVFSGNTDGLMGNSLPSLAICLVWTVGIVNAVNFLDGFDGLAAGTSVLAGLAFAVVGFMGGQPYPALVAATVAGAALGFMPWNWSPARIFLGDTGSMFLGYILAALGLMSTWGKTSLEYILIPVIVLAVPIFDMTFVVVIRLLEGRPISRPGKDHTSHRTFRMLKSVPSTALTFHLATLVMSGIAVAVTVLARPGAAIAATGLCILLFAYLGIRLAKVRVA